MSDAIHSPSSEHKQAASAHELAARQHRAAAELHDNGKEHAARLRSATAKACCMKAQTQSMLACERSTGSSPVVSTGHPRAGDIRRILDARFSLNGLEEWKNKDPTWWGSTTNAMGRGLYEQAMREAQRLESASDSALDAELAAIPL